VLFLLAKHPAPAAKVPKLKMSKKRSNILFWIFILLVIILAQQNL